MKKKLIKSLMLLMVAGGVGAFVSCKDTNVDLYNEYRAQAIADNATLQEAFEKQIEELEKQITTYESALDNIKACDCDNSALQATIDGLNTQISTINTTLSKLDTDKANKEAVQLLIDGLNGQISAINTALNPIASRFNTIADKVEAHETAKGLLEQAINDLKTQLTQIKECDCAEDRADLRNKIVDLQARMQAAENLAQQAMTLATTANTNAINAQNTASQAATDAALAKQDAAAATQTAQAATQAAADAVRVAGLAEQAAGTANTIANEAKTNANTALQTAQQALDLATSLQTIATTASDKANANEQEINLLKQSAQTLQGLIQTNANNIAKNAQDIANMKLDIQQNKNDIATNLQKITDNLNKINDNASKILANTNEINTIKTQLTTIDGTLQQVLTRANDAYAYAEANYERIHKLDSTIVKLKESINGTNQLNEEKFRTLTDNVNDLKTKTDNLIEKIGGIDVLTANLNNLKETVQGTNNTVSNLTNKLDSIGNVVTNLKAELGQVKLECANNLTAAKQYADLMIANAKLDIYKKVGEMLADYAKTTDLANYATKTELSDVKGELTEKMLRELGLDRQKLTRDSTDIEWLKKKTDELNTAIDKCVTKEAMQPWYERIIRLEDDSLAIVNALTDKINTDISNLRNEINGGLNDKIQLYLVNNKYVTEEKVADLAKPLIDAAVSAAGENYKARMDIIGDSVKKNFTDLVAVTERVATLENTTVKVDDYLVDKDDIWRQLNTNTQTIGEIQNDITTINGKLTSMQNDITDLQTRMTKAENRLDSIDDAIDEIQEDVAAIQNTLAKMVTGIHIDATNNAWFGSYSDPFGNQSNLLIAFYGMPKDNIEFPTSSSANYVRTDEALTDKDMEMIDGVEVFEKMPNIPLLYEEGYAGKIYMTINPNTADVTGLQPKIVNSLDEESYITLKPIQPSTERLKFGFTPPTRASQSSNGFYEAEAVILAKNVKKVDAPNFNLSAYKDVAENLKAAITDLAKKKSTGSNADRLENIANDLNTIVNGLRFDRSGLKVSYTTTEKDASGNPVEKTHSVYSDRNLGATAIQPLSLETLKDLNVKTLPGFKRVDNLLDRASKTVKDKIHVFFNDLNGSPLIEKIVNLKIKDISIPSIQDEAHAALLSKFLLKMDTVFVLDGLKYHLQMPITVDIPVKFEKDLEISLKGVKVPVKVEKDVEIDLTNVTVDYPTVVIQNDDHGVLKSTLEVPILDNENHQVGVTKIPLNDLVIDVPEGETVRINGTPVAHVNIDQDVTLGDNAKVSYHLVFEETFSKTVTLDKWFYFGDNGTDQKEFHLWFDYDMRDAAIALWGMAEGALVDVNTMMDDLRDIVKEVNNALDKINGYEKTIGNTIDDYVGKIKDYLDKINRVGTRIINSTNSRFQPFMVAETAKGMKRLSGSKNYPTVLMSDVTFYPTSQTMELFVPLARKHIAVTNVFKGNASAQGGDASCKAKLKAANVGQINKVLDGTVRRISMSGLASGYVYEIAYSALDFHGKIATRKYYITVE